MSVNVELVNIRTTCEVSRICSSDYSCCSNIRIPAPLPSLRKVPRLLFKVFLLVFEVLLFSPLIITPSKTPVYSADTAKMQSGKKDYQGLPDLSGSPSRTMIQVTLHKRSPLRLSSQHEYQVCIPLS